MSNSSSKHGIFQSNSTSISTSNAIPKCDAKFDDANDDGGSGRDDDDNDDDKAKQSKTPLNGFRVATIVAVVPLVPFCDKKPEP